MKKKSKKTEDTIVLTEEELSVLRNTFYVQAAEMTEFLTAEVLALDPGKDPEGPIKKIKRAFHTLKGDSSTIGLKALSGVIHSIEDLLCSVESGSVGLDDGVQDLLLRVVDEIGTAVQAHRAGKSHRVSAELKKNIASFAASPPGSGACKRAKKKPSKTEREGSSGKRTREKKRKDKKGTSKKKDEPKQAARETNAVQTIRVISEKIDQTMDILGELVMGRSLIGELITNLEAKYPKDELVGKFQNASAFVSRSLSELQRNIMSIRMVPVGRAFNSFPRMIRDLRVATGKEINLVIEGEDTEMDKALVDVLGEPLLHIIRNSADHGIEPPDAREKMGKARAGTIKVSALHKDNNIIIKIEDDGKGIDINEVKAKALKKGLVTKEAARRMSEKDLIRLIFLPEFSTAGSVSDISGRGIGMDIVKEVVEGLRGDVDIESTPGAGTTFNLRFPMTLAIMRAIIFKVGGRLYALPMGSVEEILRVFQKDLDVAMGTDMIRRREAVIPLVRLNEVLGADATPARKNGKMFVLVLSYGERKVAIEVEGLVKEEELVVKGVDEDWVDIDLVSGASILGDGSVVLILNAGAVLARASGKAFETDKIKVAL